MKGSSDDTVDVCFVTGAETGAENLKILTGELEIDGEGGITDFVLDLKSMLLLCTLAGRVEIFLGFLAFCCAAKILSRIKTSAAKKAVRDLFLRDFDSTIADESLFS